MADDACQCEDLIYCWLNERLKEQRVMLIPSSIRSTISVKRSGKKANNEFKQGTGLEYSYTRRGVLLRFVTFLSCLVVISNSKSVV